MSIITIVGFEIPDRNGGAGMRTKDQGTLDKILKFVNKYPGEVIKLKSFEVQGVARHVIKAL